MAMTLEERAAVDAALETLETRLAFAGTDFPDVDGINAARRDLKAALDRATAQAPARAFLLVARKTIDVAGMSVEAVLVDWAAGGHRLLLAQGRKLDEHGAQQTGDPSWDHPMVYTVPPYCCFAAFKLEMAVRRGDEAEVGAEAVKVLGLRASPTLGVRVAQGDMIDWVATDGLLGRIGEDAVEARKRADAWLDRAIAQCEAMVAEFQRRANDPGDLFSNSAKLRLAPARRRLGALLAQRQPGAAVPAPRVQAG